jgi:glycosyltransferase involved in cell wall biosynthesis
MDGAEVISGEQAEPNMTKPRPLLSVVIPTRNRLEYVRSAIASVLENTDQRVILVVEDNSDSSELANWVANNISDARLSYRYTEQPVSMCENYERAMGRVTGEFVCLIGDDDGVTEEIVAATAWAKENNIDALVPASVVNYVWPDLNLAGRGSIKAGELRIFEFTGSETFPSPEVEMLKCARDAGQAFHRLPKAYYGVVRKECMDRIKERTGAYFPGVSPDMAAALGLASCARRVCSLDYPLFVMGSSVKSNAGLSGLNRHIGRLREQPHLPRDCEERWSNIVPRFYSVQTIWAEAAVGTFYAMKRPDLIRKFNIPKLFALCYIFHNRYVSWGDFRRANTETGRNMASSTLTVLGYVIQWWWLRAWRYVWRKVRKRPQQKVFSATGLDDIVQAVRATNNYLSSNGRKHVRWKRCVS